MKFNRILASAVIVSGPLISIHAAAQSSGQIKAPVDSTAKAVAAQKWRTPWGDPDLQGSWLNTAFTPLQRPAKYGSREFMTPEERADYEKTRAPHDSSSIFHDPPDGRIPPLTPEGQKRQAGWHESQRRDPPGPFNGPEDLNLRTRCIIRDPLPRIPANYVNGYEIVQTPGYVAIFQE